MPYVTLILVLLYIKYFIWNMCAFTYALPSIRPCKAKSTVLEYAVQLAERRNNNKTRSNEATNNNRPSMHPYVRSTVQQ